MVGGDVHGNPSVTSDAADRDADSDNKSAREELDDDDCTVVIVVAIVENATRAGAELLAAAGGGVSLIENVAMKGNSNIDDDDVDGVGRETEGRDEALRRRPARSKPRYHRTSTTDCNSV